MFSIIALMADDPVTLTAGDHPAHYRGWTRTRLSHPYSAGYDGVKAAPVVLAFHGGLSNAAQMVHFSGLSDKADQAGFDCPLSQWDRPHRRRATPGMPAIAAVMRRGKTSTTSRSYGRCSTTWRRWQMSTVAGSMPRACRTAG